MPPRTAGLLAWPHLLAAALAACECGYVSSINGTADTALFTDMLETDFTQNPPLGVHTDWAPQAFNLTRDRARGPYGELFAVANVGVSGGKGGEEEEEEEEEGLELVVGGRGAVVDGMVPVAEVDSTRLDVWWGTFRASMRMTRVPGTCAAFFWYFNDTQEIDMEFLSREFSAANGSYPVNLVLQSREAAVAGYNAARTGTFVKAHLPFDPTDGFHEYRMDYVPGRVFFYADGQRLAEMDGPAVPTTAGHLILQHWSNGNEFWSGGPPAEDAVLAVRYVKAYFNSSAPERQRDWAARCRDPAAAGAVCSIPDVTLANASAAGWFFKNQGNTTNNQTASGQNDGARLQRLWWPAVVGLLLLASGWVVAL
ncbi:glycoside hydrolase family 16 protein [Trichocladium antarcticum]|uniref:Glycoside hydrolase family 16 protein n=1 Tax=Trichocladium antarcticum TaxID=1450529 RepID=A0AAN6ZF57_9PEZI|nr:glycoside hydrolase family 16 protein [Trichocladium antarcticum]